MHKSFRALALFTVVTLSCSMPANAQTQEVEVSYVTGNGVGTVYMAPTHVSFWTHFPLPEGDLSKGLPAAQSIELKLREYLAAKEMRPSTIDVYPPSIISLEGGLAEFSIELHFSMAGLVGGETGSARFGALCESVKDLETALECRVSGPTLLVADKSVVIQSAVKEATKDAFTASSGAASALGGAVSTVVEVHVEGIVWNDPPDTEAGYPNIEMVACTARVKVIYELRYG